LLLILLAGGAFVSWGLQHRYNFHGREKAPDNALIVMSFNIYQGTTFNGQNNFEKVSSVIKDNDVDFITLVESDPMHLFTENHDVVDYLATRNKMDSFYGLSTREGSFGTAFLSHYTLEKPEARQLGNSDKLKDFVEPWMRTSIQFNGTTIYFYGCHIDFSDELEALQQVQELLDFVNYTLLWAEPGAPVIVMGDFNFNRTSPVYLKVALSGFNDAWLDIHPLEANAITWHEKDTKKKDILDYIFYQNLLVTDAKILDHGKNADASDHYAVMAHFATL